MQDYDRASRPLVAGEDYQNRRPRSLGPAQRARRRRRHRPGNPGKAVRAPADLDDPKKTERLRRVHEALVDLGLDGLSPLAATTPCAPRTSSTSTSGGSPRIAPRVRVVHVPKTIDNDYRGIDFTFGFFTAVDVMSNELLNLRADAMATGSYFIVETMGRKAGWLAYGVAIAGEAHLVVGVEDVVGDLAIEETR